MQILEILKTKEDRGTEMSDFTNNSNLTKSVKRQPGINAISD